MSKEALPAALRAAIVLVALIAGPGASFRSQNFIVQAPNDQIARQVAAEAERLRAELAQQWLGEELTQWRAPCPVYVKVGAHLGAGGHTTFRFPVGGLQIDEMVVQGPFERILDSVLPHEITHTVFATHFRQPLPRWADEGACTTVEHSSERAKHEQMLVRFLKQRPTQGIAFARMFPMMEYPQQMMPLYAQGYSVARFLIQLKDRREFIRFLETGLADRDWRSAVEKHYGYATLGELQNTWLNWVAKGSPQQAPIQPPVTSIASTQPRPETVRGQSPDDYPTSGPHFRRPGRLQPITEQSSQHDEVQLASAESRATNSDEWSDSYYFRAAQTGGQSDARGQVAAVSTSYEPPTPSSGVDDEPEVLLEWSRDGRPEQHRLAARSGVMR